MDKEWWFDTLADIFKDFTDFSKLYPEADRKLFEDWATIADRILAYAQRDGKVHLELGDMTQDTKGESAFKVLPTLLPPSIYKKGGEVFRPTTTESRKSFIDVQPVVTNMVEYLQSAETSDAFLHILGTTSGNDIPDLRHCFGL